MRLQEDIDFTTLNWVKQELDETLRQARQALEAYAEDPADSSLMRFCATYLHQVQGTLRMVELYGAAMVVEEMEHVAQALLDDQIRVKDDAFASLLRGTLQLPDYLERLQSGHKDIPIVLLPLLNDLRACRGEKLLSEGVLFSPDLTVPLPASVKGPERPVAEAELRNVAGRLRINFQAALVKFLRDQGSSLAVTGLLNALDGLGSISFQEDARRLWWLASCLLDAIRSGDVDANAAVKLMYGRVDREIKRMVDAGEGAFRAEPPRELLKNLLYYIAQSKGSEGRIGEVKRIYQLDQLVATEQEIEQARDSMVGRNRAVLDTVSVAIKEDLLRVKDALDLFLRTANASVGDLSPQVELLDRIGDTLGVLGLGIPRRVIQEQRQSLSEITAGSRVAEEGILLDIAGALLFVEASLDDHIERMGSGDEPTATRNAAGDTSFELPQTEVRKILDSLMKEVQTNLQQIKQDVVAFVESGWEHAKAEHIPRLLDEVAGAVRMIHLNEAAELLGATAKFIEIELLRRRRVPTPDQMDRLADAVASIEFYLEATHAQRPGREQILDVTRDSLAALGYWPVPETPVFDEPAVASAAEPPPPAPPAPATSPVAESVAVAAPAASVESRDHALDFSDLQIDMDALTFAVDDGSASTQDSRFHEQEPGDASLPSIDLPGSQDLARFADRVGKVEPGMIDSTPAPQPLEAVRPELRTVVEIAPGSDVADLVVGRADTTVRPGAEQDLTGMRLVETEAGTGHDPEEDEYEYEWVEIEQEVLEPASADAQSQFQSGASDDIDEEIREVFLEEVQEEVDNLNRVVPVWVASPADFEKLKPIRRSFHTMKGSGRLVGAMALGEFSWKIEGMLNRVLDKTIAPSAAVIALLQQSIQALPQLLAGLRGESANGVDIAGIMEVADQLSAGEEAWLTSKAPVRRMETVRVQVKKPKARPAAITVAAPVELTETIDITQPMFESPAEQAELLQRPPTIEPSESINLSRLAGVDPMMLEILRSEVAGHLNTLSAYLHACADAGRPISVTEEVLRAVHTMHGAIAMVEITELNPLLGPLEGYVKRLRGAAAAPSQVGLHAIVDAATAIDETILGSEGEAADRASHDYHLLAERLLALRNELPEPESFAQVFNLRVHDEETPAQTPAQPAEDRVWPGPDQADSGAVSSADQPSPPEEFVELSDEDLALPADALALIGIADAAPAEPVRSDEELFALDFESEFVSGEESDTLEDWDVETSLQPLEEPTAAGAAAVTDAEPILLADEPSAAIASTPEDAERADASVIESHGEAARPGPETELQPAAEDRPDDRVETAEFVTDAGLAEATAAVPGFNAGPPETLDSPEILETPEAPALAQANYQAVAADSHPDRALSIADLDEELIEIFVQESRDILDASDALMVRLRDHPEELDIVVGLQRELHTLKGGARMAGLVPIGDLGHAMESLFELVADGRRDVDRLVLESLEAGFDRLHGMVSRVAEGRDIGTQHNAIARFEALAAGEIIPLQEPTAAAGAATEKTSLTGAVEIPVAAAPRARTPAKPTARDIAAEESEELVRPQQEMIRVRSDTLDKLVNYAGEVSIYRSRLEQQTATYRFNLLELEQTVLRLREQLRKLEVETEAQIIARYQREAEEAQSSAGEFDPLEMDRFSTLQQLTRALAESASDLVALQGALDDLTRQSENLLLQQKRVSSDLQEGLMRTRMVPFDSVVPRLRRLMRQTAGELGKRAQLRVEGAQGEMDRNVLDRMTAPLEHMLRNALAHGLETPAERIALGKPEEGTVLISISRESTEVVVTIRDDGRGIDREAIRRKAVERNWVNAEQQLSDRDLFAFILETGFSTAETISKIAGRGVGMDVVNSEIKQLGGLLTIDSERGRGSLFTVRLPFTLAVTQAILVRLGEHVFAVPMSSVQGVARIRRSEFDERMKAYNPVYSYAGEDYSIYELSSLLGWQTHRATDDAQLPLLMTKAGDQYAAVRVDGVLGSREIVVKSVGPQVSSVPGIFGATIMGDGSVVMILELAPIVRRAAAARRNFDDGAEIAPVVPQQIAAEVRRQPLIMVVDDSITMRKVTSRVLERNDMEVMTAKDGLDAVEKLQDHIPDLVLLDVEMPRMDGYEFATYMRNDARLKTVPIIMITSRTGEKHRQRAFEIGVDRYLGKPYQEADLLQNVEEILRLSRGVQ